MSLQPPMAHLDLLHTNKQDKLLPAGLEQVVDCQLVQEGDMEHLQSIVLQLPTAAVTVLRSTEVEGGMVLHDTMHQPTQGLDTARGAMGGLGRTNSNETTTTEDNRNALFGGAKERYAQKGALPPTNGRPGGGYSADSGTSGTQGGYGAYGEERQLTAEEEEEEDVQATKQQIRFMKQEDVSSTRNALRIAAQAEETGRATLARLGAQGERIHNTEKNLDLAANHNRVAEEKAKELKTLNRSMFAVHVANPFTASSRRAERDQEIIQKHQQEREQRDATRQAAFGSQQRMESAFKDLQPGDPGYRGKQTKASLAERSKYQFEADSEDDEMENEIDSNLDALGHAAGRLNLLARATGREVDEQNKHIDNIIIKVSVFTPWPSVYGNLLTMLAERSCG